MFVCTHNSARSQLAAALWSWIAAPAGSTRPIRDEIRRRVERLLAEVGVTSTA